MPSSVPLMTSLGTLQAERAAPEMEMSREKRRTESRGLDTFPSCDGIGRPPPTAVRPGGTRAYLPLEQFPPRGIDPPPPRFLSQIPLGMLTCRFSFPIRS